MQADGHTARLPTPSPSEIPLEARILLSTLSRVRSVVSQNYSQRAQLIQTPGIPTLLLAAPLAS